VVLSAALRTPNDPTVVAKVEKTNPLNAANPRVSSKAEMPSDMQRDIRQKRDAITQTNPPRDMIALGKVQKTNPFNRGSCCLF
jgi:hypothetical protein